MSPGLLDRILGRNPRENALVELVNLFNLNGFGGVSRNDVADIEARFRVDLAGRHKEYAVFLYKSVLGRLLGKEGLSREDQVTLRHVAEVLRIGREEAEELTRGSAEPVFNEAVRRALRDGKLTHRERQVLERLRSDLRLSPKDAERIVAGGARRLLDGKVRSAVSDRRLSDTEEKDIRQSARRMSAEGVLKDCEGDEYRRSRRMWQIEDGRVPEVPPSRKAAIVMDRGERCYYRAESSWYLPRDARSTGSIREQLRNAARSGSDIEIQKEEMICRAPGGDWRRAGRGNLHITSRRIVFSDEIVVRRFELRDVPDIVAYRNGIAIVEEHGAGRYGFHFFELRDGPEPFLRVYARAVSDLM